MIELLILTIVAAGMFAALMLISRTHGDDGETVVGVQRHGRTFFVRRDQLQRWTDQGNSLSDDLRRDHLARISCVVGLVLVTALALLSVSRLS